MENKNQELISQLKWKLDQLKSEIQKNQIEIEQRTAIVAEKQEQVERLLKVLEVEGVKIDRTDLDGIIPVSLSEIIIKILKDKGEPMHYKQITEAVTQSGHRVQGQNPPATIIALLHRKKEDFVRVGEGLWALKEWGVSIQKKAVKRKKKRRTVRKKK